MDCFQIDEAYRRKLQRENPAELAFGDYTIGRYAWVMADAILFNKPIPAKGKARTVELGRRDTGWTMRISAAVPATGTKNAVESFNVSMRVQKALQ